MAKPRIKLAVFISGGGTNLQALIDACAREDYPAEIAVVISNVPSAYGLERAKKAGILTATIDHKDFNDRETFEDTLLVELAGYDVDLVCLAGFMRILTPRFIEPWTGRMLNIHPSLLPKYKGLNTHARAIEAGDSESGCTIHHVVPDVDSGEIIVQKTVPIKEGDTPDILAARILEQEHIAYPEAVERLAKQILDA